MRFTEQGVPFFIDHNTKSTTYNDPRTGKPVGPLGANGLPMSFERTFRWKIAQFRYLCLVSHLLNTYVILKSNLNSFPISSLLNFIQLSIIFFSRTVSQIT